MIFSVIPEEQTPELAMIQDEFIMEYIERHRESLVAFLEYASSRTDAVGLAANQCSLGEINETDSGMNWNRYEVRAFAFGGRARNWRLVIDPVITKYIGIKEMKAEGCLTWKNLTIAAERSRAVEVSYYDMDGVLHEGEIYKGFEGQIWQHEVNHLNGVEENVVYYFKEPAPIEVGRNEPCPCGSGKKYKKCCLLLK